MAAYETLLEKLAEEDEQELLGGLGGNDEQDDERDDEDEQDDEQPATLAAVRSKLRREPSYAGVELQMDVRRLLEQAQKSRRKAESEAATKLVAKFEKLVVEVEQQLAGKEKDEKDGGGAGGSGKEAPTPTASKTRAAAAREAAAGGKVREFTEKDRRQMVERMLVLPGKPLVEMLHALKKVQPELDLGLDASKIVVRIEDLTPEALQALEDFLKAN